MSSAAIVHLIGFPGAGKYTIAGEVTRLLDARGSRCVLVDNHYTSNVIFGVMDVDGRRPVPPEVWTRVEEVRDAVFRTMETLSPPDWSFVFTNVLTEEEPRDAPAVARLAAVARARGCPYVPVRIVCQLDELARRAGNDDRRARIKWIDADAVTAFAASRHLLSLDAYDSMDIDVTHVDAATTAARIVEHVDDRTGTLPAHTG